jgi:hypothetical protein
MNLQELVREIKNYDGLRRKKAVGGLVKALEYRDISEDVLASFGEDAAVIEYSDEEVLLLAADGIWSKLMAEPEWAGYCAVLVNLHDIAAMGGSPIAMVDVLSITSRSKCYKIAAGMRKGIEKFGIPVVGGHIHPDAPSDSLDIMIIGRARRDGVIYSSTARGGDSIVVAVDLDGKIHPTFSFNWDTTSSKDRKVLLKQMESMKELGERKLVTAGKDISNPGVIGTIGMLLEVSQKGGEIYVDRVPRPEGMSLSHWVKVYPGMGFIVTCREEVREEVIDIFRKHGLEAEGVGKVTNNKRMYLIHGEERELLFDFNSESIFGF